MKGNHIVSIVFGSILYGFFPFLIIGIIKEGWWGANWYVAWIGCAILCAPFVYFSEKGDSTCPSCKKTWAAEQTGEETIDRQQILKRETETRDGVSTRVNVPYEIRNYWVYLKCESCDHTWRVQEQSERKQ
jgi:hypothetical protein